MKSYGKCMVVLFLLAGISSGNAFCAEMNLQSMSLEEILNMKVSIASKKSETISESPAIVSVITAQDIARLGYENLGDVIKTVPGVTVTESFFGYADYSFRGIKETNYNNRTLLLINGTPIREATNNQYWLEICPVSAIERIEVIRGPGSVLYGSNAFSGVINVIMKSKANTTEVSLLGGSKNLVEGSINFGRDNETVSYFVGASYHNSNGYEVMALDELNKTQQLGAYEKDTKAYQNNYNNFFGNISKGAFGVNAYGFIQDKDKFGITPVHSYTGSANTQAGGMDVQYKKDFVGCEFTSKLNYFQSAYNGYMALFPVSGALSGVPMDMKYAGSNYGLAIDGYYKISEEASANFGVAYNSDQTDPYKFISDATKVSPLAYGTFVNGEPNIYSAWLDKHDTNDSSLYGQLDIMLSDQMRIIGGFRYNNNKDYGSTTVPRASMVYKAADKLFLKLLYGSAYRNPSFFEKYVNTKNTVYGDPDLKPEKINTVELGADWTLSKTTLKCSVFNIATDNMINRVNGMFANGSIPKITILEPRNGTTLPTRSCPGYANTSGETINGVEAEVRGELAGELLGYALNASYKDGKEKDAYSLSGVAGGTPGDKIQYLDKTTANVSLFNEIAKFTNTVNASYVGERTGNIDGAPPSGGPYTAGQEITVPAFTLVNVKSTYKINENIDVSIIVMNLFEQTVLFPEYIRRNIATIPGDSGRNIYGKVAYKF